MMKRKPDFVTIAAAVAFVAVLFLAAIVLRPAMGIPQIAYQDGPLVKNKMLGIGAGEFYQYSFSVNGTEANLTFATLPGDGCVKLVILENPANYSCVKPDGTDEGGSNSSLANPMMVMFRPWMLALRDGWRWNSTMYVIYGPKAEKLSETSYRVVRMENYSGREAFVVAVESTAAAPEYAWVDAKKRILLKMVGGNYEITLQNWSSAG